MMSASDGGGGHGKVDIVREVAWILYYKSVSNADNGGRGLNKSYICRTSLMQSPRLRGPVPVPARPKPCCLTPLDSSVRLNFGLFVPSSSRVLTNGREPYSGMRLEPRNFILCFAGVLPRDMKAVSEWVSEWLALTAAGDRPQSHHGLPLRQTSSRRDCNPQSCGVLGRGSA